MAEQASFVALQPPASLRLADAVWGIDPSTLRVSVAVLAPAAGAPVLSWATCSLPRNGGDPARWFAAGLGALVSFVRALVVEHGAPLLVYVEEPFAGGKLRVHPSSNRMLGVLLAALGHVLGAASETRLVGPQSWKKAALGAGRGHAEKGEIMAWAHAAGYDGDLQDEADAIGIATAAGVELEARARGRARGRAA